MILKLAASCFKTTNLLFGCVASCIIQDMEGLNMNGTEHNRFNYLAPADDGKADIYRSRHGRTKLPQVALFVLGVVTRFSMPLIPKPASSTMIRMWFLAEEPMCFCEWMCASYVVLTAAHTKISVSDLSFQHVWHLFSHFPSITTCKL